MAQYDPSKDLEQLGEGFEIVPVPFTASPLGLLEKMEQAVGSYPKFEGLAFDKPTWKPTLVRVERKVPCAYETGRLLSHHVSDLHCRFRVRGGRRGDAVYEHRHGRA